MGYFKEMRRREGYWELPGDDIYRTICDDQIKHLKNVLKENIESAEQIKSEKTPWNIARKLFLQICVGEEENQMMI